MLRSPAGAGSGASPSARSGRPRPDRLNIHHATTWRIRINESRHPCRAAAAAGCHLHRRAPSVRKSMPPTRSGLRHSTKAMPPPSRSCTPSGQPHCRPAHRWPRGVRRSRRCGTVRSRPGSRIVTLKAVQVNQFGNAAREIGEFSLDAPNAQKQTTHDRESMSCCGGISGAVGSSTPISGTATSKQHRSLRCGRQPYREAASRRTQRVTRSSCPPCASTNSRQIDRPSPSPPAFDVTNGWNSRSATSAAMPGPVSATAISTASGSGPRRNDQVSGGRSPPSPPPRCGPG